MQDLISAVVSFLVEHPWLLAAVKSLVLLVCVLLSTAVLIYAERKIWAAVQLRRGPNVVGPWGVLQPFADFFKFLLKEPVIPDTTNKFIFVLAPVVGVVLAMAAWAVIPVNDGWVVADINVGVLYLFAVSSLGVYSVIMAGWASNSKYPFLSALRSAAQMVSYEVSIGFVIVTVLLCAGSLNLTDIVHAQDTKYGVLGWYWLRLLPMYVIFFISILAETNRPPFDLAEAESEARRGLHDRIFGLALPAAVPDRARRHPRHVGADDDPLPRRLALALSGSAAHRRLRASSGSCSSCGASFFLFAMTKAIVPRYRYDQLMRLGWKVFLPISLVMVILVAAAVQFGPALAKAG